MAALTGVASFGEDVGIGVVFEPGATALAGDHMAVGQPPMHMGRMWCTDDWASAG